MIGAICFGAAFGLPFVAWGAILIFDRDRSWQRYVQRYQSEAPQRTPAWHRRQIISEVLLLIFGATIIAALQRSQLSGSSPFAARSILTERTRR